MWDKTGVVLRPEAESGDAGYNATDDLLPITLVMYAAALNPGGTSSVSLVVVNILSVSCPLDNSIWDPLP